MIKGSHNTMSYLSDRRLWMRPFDMWSRCQDKSIKQQWESGVRSFDFRVVFIKGRMYFAHGLSVYENDEFQTSSKAIAYVINKSYETREKAYIRIILEREIDKTSLLHFKNLCIDLEDYRHTLVKFQFGIKKPWHIFQDEFDKEYVEISKQYDVKWHSLIPIKWWTWEQERIRAAIKSIHYSGIVAQDFV